MRRITLAAALTALALLLSVLPAAPPAGADDLAAAQARADKAARASADAETRLGKLEGQINDLEAQASVAQGRLDGLRSAVQELAVEQLIGAGTAGGMLTEGDLNRGARAAALSRYATQTNQDAVDEFTSISEDLAVAKASISAKREQAKAAAADLKKKAKALEAELARLQEAERRRQAEEARRKAAASRAAAAKSSAKSTVSKGTAVRVGGGPTGVIASGAWVCPVQGPNSFVDSWGAARSGGRRHQGVDMMSPRGTPTVAPVAGRVVLRGNSTGGLSWHLYGDDGHYYYGTHLDSYANVSGHVSAGTVLGYVGDSGNAKGAGTHLHFEIHPNNGAAVNPYPTVRKYC